MTAESPTSPPPPSSSSSSSSSSSMSQRVLRQRRPVNYRESSTESPPSDFPPSPSPLSPLRSSSSNSSTASRRSKRQRAEEKAQQDAAVADATMAETEEEEQKCSSPAADGAPQSAPSSAEPSTERADVEHSASEEEWPARAEVDAEDEEWREEEKEAGPQRRGKDKSPQEEAIVVDDEEVNRLFSLPAPAPSRPLLHRPSRGMLGGGQRKRKRSSRSAQSSLLPSGRPAQRPPVTVSKEEAISLEDSLEAFPSAQPPTPAQPSTASSASSRPKFSFEPPSHRRKAAAASSASGSRPVPAPSTAAFSSHAASLAAMRQVLGPGFPDSTLQRFLLAANYNCDRAISDVLDSPSLSSLMNEASPSTSAIPPPRPPHTEPSAVESSTPTTSTSPPESSDDEEDGDKEAAEEDEQREEAHPTVESREGRDAAPAISWTRKLLVVLRVDAGCTTEGERILAQGDSVTFRDQTRDSYHLRQLRQQQMQGGRKGAKQFRREVRAERKKERRILRFVPSAQPNALEIGTLPRHVSDVLVPLFDRKLIDLTAEVASPCPVKFDLLSSIPLLLSVWVLPAVFELKREVRVERKGFMGKVAADAADVDLNPLDTFLALLTAFHIEPIASSMREEESKLDSAPAIDLSAIRQAEEAKAGDGATTAGEGESAAPAEKEEDAKDAVKLSPFQLSALYSSAQAQYANLPSLEASPRLKTSLKFYQKQALYWMTNRELLQRERLRQEGKVRRRHPLWDEYAFVGGERFYVNPFNSQIQLDFPESSGLAMGGILGDEMGLGKTVMMISCILSSFPSERIDEQRSRAAEEEKREGKASSEEARTSPSSPPVNRSTLIVVPMSLLAQWRDEIHRFSDLSVYLYYSSERGSAATLRAHDVVITSYGTLASEAKKFQAAGGHRGSSTLFSMTWFRAVLDEAHIIRNRLTEASKACFLLQAERRWTLTGTPIQNRLDDVFPLLHFLKEEPWSDLGWWRRVIARPFQEQDPRALQRLKAVLQPLLLRRTKAMKNQNGDNILDLPPREEEILRLNFSETERDFYQAVFTRSKTQIEGYVREGSILNKYIQVLTLLLRLRQACDHPYLTVGRGRSEKQWESDIANFISRFAARNLRASIADKGGMSVEYIAEIGETLKKMRRAAKETRSIDEMTAGADEEAKAGDASQLPSASPSPSPTPQVESALPRPLPPPPDDEEEEESWAECPVCLSPPNEPVLTECGHVLCRECALGLCGASTRGRCCICRCFFSALNLMAVPLPQPTIAIDFEKEFKHSAKTERLLQEIAAMRRDDPKIKALIFSQWTSMLDLVQIPLKREGYKFLRLDGAMSQQQRESVLYQFKTDPSQTLLLISLKAGGVGLNLVAASVVYFLDLWFNPAVEQQAIDRVHRIGQTRTVRVKRFVIVDSVEERILELQEKKRMLAHSVHSQDMGTGGAADVNLLLQCLR